MNVLINQLIMMAMERMDKEGDDISDPTFAVIDNLSGLLATFGPGNADVSPVASQLLKTAQRRIESEAETEPGLSWKTVRLLELVRRICIYL